MYAAGYAKAMNKNFEKGYARKVPLSELSGDQYFHPQFDSRRLPMSAQYTMLWNPRPPQVPKVTFSSKQTRFRLAGKTEIT